MIDDLPFVVDPHLLAALDSLVAGLGPRMRLTLVSRTRPPLRLARGVVAGNVVRVRGKDLFFSPEETRDALLARRVRGEDDIAAHVSAIQELTGGWPVAVALTARLPLAVIDPERTQLGDTGRDSADYLTEEVFLAQPPQVQQFLLDTAVLDTLSVKDANELRGQLDAAAHMDYLERNALFLSPVPQQSPMCWQLHSVIRGHLGELPERDEPSRWAELHRKAALLFAASDLERAMSRAGSSGVRPSAGPDRVTARPDSDRVLHRGVDAGARAGGCPRRIDRSNVRCCAHAR